MSFYNSYNDFKKAGLLFLLITPSMVIYADMPDMSGETAKDTRGSVDQPQLMGSNFPRWSERQRVEKEAVPPPPPGPYMSLGLNDFPVSETSFNHGPNRPQVPLDSSGAPIETFSPDVPWPKNIRPTKRWMPEDGYRYVNPQVEKNLYPGMQNNPSGNYNYGHPATPYMGWPGANWAPPMGAVPAAPYRYAPDYDPRYNASANSNRLQQANPAYRAPYPAPGKP